MPARSKRQLRYLFANKPALAKEFADATPNIKALPERAKGKSLEHARKRRRRRGRKGTPRGPVRADGRTVSGAMGSTDRVGY